MKKFALVAAAAGLMSLAACGGDTTPEQNAADVAAENLEALADNYEALADNTSNEAAEAMFENAADNLEVAADNVRAEADANSTSDHGNIR